MVESDEDENTSQEQRIYEEPIQFVESLYTESPAVKDPTSDKPPSSKSLKNTKELLTHGPKKEDSSSQDLISEEPRLQELTSSPYPSNYLQGESFWRFNEGGSKQDKVATSRWGLINVEVVSFGQSKC